MSVITDIVAGIADPVADLLSEFITDKDEQNRLAHQIALVASTQSYELIKGQIENNIAEAASKSLLVSGWRPAAGWCCVAGMAVNFLVIPLFGPLLTAYTRMNIEPLDLSVMLPVLLGMLGLTVARSVDKLNGVA